MSKISPYQVCHLLPVPLQRSLILVRIGHHAMAGKKAVDRLQKGSCEQDRAIIDDVPLGGGPEGGGP